MAQGHNDERPAMLREADHRVRNDLQLISSLVGLHARKADGEAARAGFQALGRRIAAVSLASRHLVRRDGREWTDAAALIGDLARELASPAGVSVELALEPLTIPAWQGTPLALLAGEMIVNALAHGFPGGRAGTVAVRLEKTSSGFSLTVRDDGVGMSGSLPGFGLTIAQLMARQLRGALATTDAQPGVAHSVSVPMETSASTS